MNKAVLLHPTPYPNESLANYIIRIKDINFIEMKWIYERLDLPKSKYLRQFNLIQKEETLSELSNLICLDIEKIKSMILNKYFSLGSFKGESYDDRYIDHYVLDSNRSKYCPKCLAEEPYHRLYWQMRKIRICLKHNITLVESCTNCWKALDIKNIVEGKCDCGHLLMDVNVQKCTDDLIINYQKYIYKIYNVNLDNETIEKNQEYSKAALEILTNFIEDLVKTYKDIYLESDLLNHKEKNNSFQDMEYAEKIRTNLPIELTQLLDLFNDKLDYLMINRGEALCNNYLITFQINQAYSPLFCLRLVDLHDKFFRNLECAKHIDNLLIEYFYARYNTDFIINRMKKAENNISEEISILEYNERIMNIFEIDDETLSSIVNSELSVRVIDNSDNLYNTVNKIVSLFLTIIKKSENIDSEISYDKKYISLYEVYNIFSELYISFIDIVSIIINDKIDIVINPFYVGTHMIYVPKEIMKKKLLNLAIQHIKLDG